tara:strand:+ start:582 stop:845 length:264 start_codon:yes stop_codon:yes gene_type:complete
MLKEIKYLIFLLFIIFFIFFTGKYYFSDDNKKNSYRSFKNINDRIEIYSKNLPIIDNDTDNIIEYVKNTKSKKKKKFYFWELINKDD